MVWGPIGDRIGRVRALMLTILCYSLFTFVRSCHQCLAACDSPDPVRHWHRRRAAGWRDLHCRRAGRANPENRRGLDAHRLLFGFFLPRSPTIIGANFGWRWMFVFGGLPALMIAFIRYGVHESKMAREVRRGGAQASDDVAGVRRSVYA